MTGGTGRTALPRVTTLAAALLLAGCGGGGGQKDGGISVVPGSPTPSAPAPTPGQTAEQQEFARSNAAVAARADAAYLAGATGRGIRIAVIDTGITRSLSEFSGRIDPASADMGGNRGLVDLQGHGTYISAVAAAARDGRGMHGVAFGATILSYNVTRSGRCTQQACPLQSELIARAIDAAVASGARVINMSFGGDQIDPSVIAAVRRAAAAGVVMVKSVGNDGSEAEPKLLAREMVAAGGGLVILAGGHDIAGRANPGGNPAGSGAAASAYLSALAVEVNGINPDGTIATMTGSSASAAVVSGAVALVAEARPRMTGAEIVALLLGTAADAGAPGQDPVYGRGVLNLANAFAALPPG